MSKKLIAKGHSIYVKMITRREDKNLIHINEVISRAQKMGVDFGNGDPKNRLRYYTKIGLLPHAQRKIFNNNFPEGAYPESVIERLIEIDREVKNGINILALKRKIIERDQEEQKREKVLTETPFALSDLTQNYYSQSQPVPQLIQEEFFTKEKPAQGTEVIEVSPSKFDKANFSGEKKLKLKKITGIKVPTFFSFLKFGFVFLICGIIIFFIGTKINIKNNLNYLLANIGDINKLAQSEFSPEFFSQEEILASPLVDPYLTINATTVITGPLDAKESVSSPVFILTQENFKGSIISSNLTADRTYTLPNQSGTICLSTGNCFSQTGEEVFSAGGSEGSLAKFISSQRLGDASIKDFYTGTSITIGSTGNVGIGEEIGNPLYELHVGGAIQAAGDICTDLENGICLSKLAGATSSQGTTTIINYYGGGGGGGGIGGSGSTNQIPLWTSSGSLGNSIIYQGSGNIGIGTTTPSASSTLDVAGTIKMLGFLLPTNATSGYILTSDASGIGTWQPAPSGVIPSGSAGQTLRHDGATWLADSFLYNNGSSIGIGTTSTLSTLTVAGDGLFQGPLTISTSSFPQLTLKYDDNNYLRFSIDATQTEILASKTMVINSLTGEIKLGDDTTLFNATSATVWGASFISPDGDATVRKSGELLLRSSTPIFRYSVPSQTATTSFIRISKYFSSSLDFLPSVIPGSTRKFAFLINFADDIATSASSTWRVYRPSASTTTTTLYFAGQDLSSLDEGAAHLTIPYTLPDDDWQLEVSLPPGGNIRIFNVFLLAYDEIN